MSRSIRLDGDEGKARRNLPEALRRLFLLKTSASLGGDSSLWQNNILPDGTTIKLSTIFGHDTVIVNSPLEESIMPGVFGGIYLVTIAVPVNIGDDFTYYDDYDADNLHIHKSYIYRLNEEEATLRKIGTPLPLTYNEFTTGSGLNLVLQEGYGAGDMPVHYAQLSHMHSHEEEIGSIDWRNFQAGGGWNLFNLGNPDQNTYWGYPIVRFYKIANYGSLKGLEHPSPLTQLHDTYAARKGYVLSGNNITYTDLVYVRHVVHEDFAPPYWDYLKGQAMFVGIVEHLNPNFRWVFEHGINARPEGSNDTETVLIATDENDANPSYGLGLNWKYHVPIMLVSNNKALMRIVDRKGTNKTCWDATLNEELVIGTGVNHDHLKQISFFTDGGLSATEVIGSNTINNFETQGYYLDGCQQHDQTFAFTGGGGYTVVGNAIIADGSVCGTITATGTCISCGISASMRIKGQGGRWESHGSCGITPNWACFGGGSTWTEVEDMFEKLACGTNACWDAINQYCCDKVSYDCTGDCSIDIPCYSCDSDGRFLPPNDDRCSHISVVTGTICYKWSC